MLHSAYSTLHNDQRDFKNHQQFERLTCICYQKQSFFLYFKKKLINALVIV